MYSLLVLYDMYTKFYDKVLVDITDKRCAEPFKH